VKIYRNVWKYVNMFRDDIVERLITFSIFITHSTHVLCTSFFPFFSPLSFSLYFSLHFFPSCELSILFCLLLRFLCTLPSLHAPLSFSLLLFHPPSSTFSFSSPLSSSLSLVASLLHCCPAPNTSSLYSNISKNLTYHNSIPNHTTITALSISHDHLITLHYNHLNVEKFTEL
jgi:hypothetical protein